MAKGIVMLHGANAGGWCFERFRTVFESLGWTCHTPDLIGHGNATTAFLRAAFRVDQRVNRDDAISYPRVCWP